MAVGYRLLSFPYGFRSDFEIGGAATYPSGGNSNLARLNWLTGSGTFAISATAHTDDVPVGAYQRNGFDVSCTDSGSWTRDISGYSGFDGLTMASLIDYVDGTTGIGAQLVFNDSGTVSIGGTQPYSTDPTDTRYWDNYRWVYQFTIGWDPTFSVARPQGMDPANGNKYVFCYGLIQFEAELIDSVSGSLGYSAPCGAASLYPSVVDPPDLSGPTAIFKRGGAGMTYVDPMGYNSYGMGGDLGQEAASTDGATNGIISASMSYSVTTIYTPKNSF